MPNPPLVAFHLAGYLKADDLLAQEPERELSGIYPEATSRPTGISSPLSSRTPVAVPELTRV
jgi:hypothetical protein